MRERSGGTRREIGSRNTKQYTASGTKYNSTMWKLFNTKLTATPK